MVAKRRAQALPALQPHPHPGRYGRQQWGAAWRLEARDSAPTVRWPGTPRHRLSLSFRRLQMEPIEHRLFSQISRNWAAEPLDSYEKALKFIRTTTTTTGLKVTARLDTTY